MKESSLTTNKNAHFIERIGCFSFVPHYFIITKNDTIMKKILFIAALLCLLITTTPVSAQLIIRNNGHAEIGFK